MNDKKFSKRNEIFRKNENGEVVIEDLITNNLNTFVLNWLLNFDMDDVPAEFKQFITSPREYKSGDKKIYRRFFAVRDLYRYLNLPDTDLKYKVTASNIFWYLLLSEPEFRNIKYLTEGKDSICRVLANVLATYLNKEIKHIASGLKELEKELENDINKNNNSSNNSSDNCKDDSSSNNSNNSNNSSNNSNNNSIMHKIMHAISNNYATRGDINRIKIKMHKVMESILDYVGKESVHLAFDNNDFLDVKISRQMLNKIKITGNKLYDFYVNNDIITQVYSQYPKQIDYSLADELLFLEKVANGGFVNTEHKSKIVVDLYLDCSGSMDNKKILIAKGIIKQLLKLRVKFGNKYLFNEDLTQVDDLKQLFSVKADGGTDINKVLKNIDKCNKKALIISDLEDDIDVEIIKRLKNKISLIFVGNNPRYYEKYWKNYITAEMFNTMEV